MKYSTEFSENVLRAINNERIRQDKKWGKDRHQHHLYWLGILMEEVGEASKDLISDDAAHAEFELVPAAAVLVQAAAVLVQAAAVLVQAAAVLVCWLEQYQSEGVSTLMENFATDDEINNREEEPE